MTPATWSSSRRSASGRWRGRSEAHLEGTTMAGFRFMILVVAVVLAARMDAVAQMVKGKAKDVLDVAKESEDGKDVTKKAAALKKGFGNVRGPMAMYNARARGGIGFGAKGSGIERRLIKLGEDGLSAEALKKEAADL